MKIVLVTNFDAAGAASKLRRCILKHSPHHCRLITVSPHPYGYEPDICLENTHDFKPIRKLLAEADVLQFVNSDWDTTMPFGPIKWPEWLKGKKITVLLLGQPFILNPRALAEKYARWRIKVIPAWDRVAEELDGQNWVGLPTPMPDPLEEPYYEDIFSRRPEPDGLIRVAHCPSNELIKGSFLFARVMKRIGQRFKNVRPLLIQGASHREALRALWSSDIVFDEIWVEGTWGQSGMEACALGKPVLAHLADSTIAWWKKTLGCPHLPIINVTPDTLEEELLKLIEDKGLREEKGRGAREWFKTYWDSPQAVEKIISFYETLAPFEM